MMVYVCICIYIHVYMASIRKHAARGIVSGFVVAAHLGSSAISFLQGEPA